MKLATARVTNFRSVEDSGEFTLDQVLCLVGKNEAGKTAIVQALAGLNPHPSTPIAFDKERDYPRRFLTDYATRHGDEEAVVITTKWILSEEEKEAITETVGKDSLTGDAVTISRSYEDKEPSWHLPIDFKKAVHHILQEERLSAIERAPLANAKDTQTLGDALSKISPPTAKHTRLLERIDAFPGKTITGAVRHLLKDALPRFMYFSHYDRMNGQIRLDTFHVRRAGQQQPAVESGELVFLDFLQYAGTSVDEILATTTYEGLNARCEAASNNITAQLLEYWTQNPDLEIEVRVTKAESHDAPPFH
jgi:energy-coupling factor transporter ATP-binding protein EcfA2